MHAINFIYSNFLEPSEYQYWIFNHALSQVYREKAGSNRHTPLRQSGTLPIMLFSL